MAFTGKATYSAFAAEVAVDVSPIIAVRAPIVTPVLDLIGDAMRPVIAESTEHTWREDEYAPAFTLICSSAITSVTAGDVEAHNVDFAPYVQVGDIVQLGSQDDANGVEHIQIASIAVTVNDGTGATSLYFRRAVFGTSIRSATAGTSLTFLANASLEGEAQRPDISRVRVTKTNWVQPFVKPVEVSLSMDAVTKYSVGSEFNFQAQRRMDEALRDLENACLRGTSG